MFMHKVLHQSGDIDCLYQEKKEDNLLTLRIAQMQQ